MTPFRNLSKRPKILLTKGMVMTSLAGALLFSSCGSSTEYVEEEVVEMTKGVITKVAEVSPNEFKIVDEQVIDDKNASLVITDYLDGKTDTMNLAEIEAWSGDSGSYNGNTTAQDTSSHYRRRSGIGSLVMYGFMGYMLGRTTAPRASAYRNQSTYNRVNSNTGTTLNNTAKRTTVRKPSTSNSYGGSRSTRSYGG